MHLAGALLPFIVRYFIAVVADVLAEHDIAQWQNILVDIRNQVLSDPDFKPDSNEASADILLSGIVNNDFLSNRWVKYTKDLPIVIIETSNSIRSIGNVMGSVFTSWSCAQFSGAHAIVLDRLDPKLSGISHRVGSTFFTALPEIIVNKNPHKTRAEVLEDYKKLCPNNDRYPWSQSAQPIDKFIPYFRAIVQEPMHKQLLSIGLANTQDERATAAEGGSLATSIILPQHQLNNSHTKLAQMNDIPDLYFTLSVTEREQLPVYPDVVVQYRCSDNIFSTAMGLLQFHDVIDSIPRDAKYIFILTEDEVHTGRMSGSSRFPHEMNAVINLCRPILEALSHDIQKAFPTARVVVRRGGNGELFFEVLAMMMYSSTVICSVSTFCFYFALSNPHGRVILPSWSFHGHLELDCCGNVVMRPDMKAVGKWIAPDGQVMSDTNFAVESMIEILRNRSYHH